MNVGGGGGWPALMSPTIFGGGGSAVRCFGFFVFLMFILSN